VQGGAVKSVSSRRVGVLGGTFDPIHIGHLIIAEEAREHFALDEVLFVPARISPHKLGDSPADGGHRLRMVELAVAGNAHLSASRVDLDRPGPSYTVDTLEILRSRLGDVDLYFVMGMDSLGHLDMWREPKRILRLARLVVVTRPGHDVCVEALEQQLPGLRENVLLLTTVNVGISSTGIRERVRRGRSIRYRVPPGVDEYIREHGLYAATAPCGSTERPASCS